MLLVILLMCTVMKIGLVIQTFGVILQKLISFTVFLNCCVLSWHCNRRKGGYFYHQGGEMKACKRMVVFKCLVMTLALGSRSKQGHRKVWAKNATQESHSHSQECKRV
jgi:hypothetical protein